MNQKNNLLLSTIEPSLVYGFKDGEKIGIQVHRILSSGLGEFSDLDLPVEIINGLNRFMISTGVSDSIESVDCLGFIVEILGGDRGDRFVDDGDYDYLGAEIIQSSSELISGDIICMCMDMEGFQKGEYHYALYIGHDIFVSKLGYGGPIVTTNMSQLRGICPGYDLISKLALKYRGQK